MSRSGSVSTLRTVGQVGVAQAGQGVGFVVTIPEFAVQVQRLLAVGNGFLVLTEVTVASSDAVERIGLAELVAGLERLQLIPDEILSRVDSYDSLVADLPLREATESVPVG